MTTSKPTSFVFFLIGTFVVSTLIIAGSVVFFAGEKDAHAIVGRPVTPVSYAGVARRTSRRTTTRVVAASTYPAGAVTALPSTGCARISRAGTVYFQCGASYYRPYYDGPQVVYVPATL